MSNLTPPRRRVPAALAGWLLLAGAPAVPAATLQVSTTADTLNSDSQCSLREAIGNVNDGASTWADCTPVSGVYGTDDTLHLPAGTYRLSLAGPGEDNNASGDLDIRTSLALVGAGAATTVIDGDAGNDGSDAGDDRVLDITSPGGTVTVSLDGLTLTHGYVGGIGGAGIYCHGGTGSVHLSASRTVITANTAPMPGNGGGIYASSCPLTITDSTFSDNSAANHGGGLYTDSPDTHVTRSVFSNNTASSAGGGIFNGGGTLTLAGTTLIGNTAVYGGGLYNNATLHIGTSTLTLNEATFGGGLENVVTATLSNTTLSENSAQDMGGGLLNLGTLDVAWTTIVRNTAPASWGGGIYQQSGAANFQYSIVADNPSGGNCAGSGVAGTSGNLASDATCGSFGQSGTLVQGTGFLALADNGGPTRTHALTPGSPALDAAPDCAGQTTDQRGIARPQGAACDVGAVEMARNVSTAPIPALGPWGGGLLSLGLAALAYARVRRPGRA